MRKLDRACSQVGKLLDAYFEGTLPRRQEEMVAAHLRDCAACSSELRQIERMAAALAAVPRGEPGAEVVRQVSARVAALPSPASRRWLTAGWRRLETLAAACVAFLACWRYAVPLALSGETTLLIGRWVKLTAVSLATWLGATPDTAQGWLLAAREVPAAAGPMASALAPTIGLYAAAEAGVIVAIIILGHRVGRAKPASLLNLLL